METIDVIELQTELLEKSNKLLGIKKSKRDIANLEQYKKLKKIGFNNFQLKKKSSILKFPSFKILHSTVINEICKKYGLFFGTIDRFIAEIPKKNAEEILKNYNYLESIISKDDEIYEIHYSTFFNRYKSKTISKEKFINEHGLDNFDLLKKAKKIKLSKTNYEYYPAPIKIKVLAPLKDFDLKGTKIKNNKIVKKVEDPIVVGKISNKLWIVLSAWGPESNDVNIFNEFNN